MTESERTRPSAKTRAEEEADALVKAEPGAAPTAEEEAAAARAESGGDEVSESYKEAIERGANQKGEGQIP